MWFTTCTCSSPGEVGFIGLAVFLTAFLLAMRKGFRVFRRDPSGMAGVGALGISMALSAQLFHGLFDPGFRINLPVSQLIFCLLGVLEALDRMTATREHPVA